ncbi:hypothetical protein SAMN05444161_8581 [Rhizobiales bacterium GAS191]|nr:hypothetical protein SAMN05444161_8581 [Rhizobiales bacterium GAS191]
MPLSKTLPKAIDLDDLWQQLRDGACPAPDSEQPRGRAGHGDERHAERAASARSDSFEVVSSVPEVERAQAFSFGRGVGSSRGLALAVPPLLVTIGLGAAIVMHASPKYLGDEGPVTNASDAAVAQLDHIIGGHQALSQSRLGGADPSSKSIVPAEQSVEAAAAKAVPPDETTETSASSGSVIASGPASPLGAGPAPSPVVSSSLPSMPSLAAEATPQAPASLPPATPSLPPVAASTKAEAIASALSLPDELVDSSVSPRTRSTGEAISEGPSPVVADLATPQARASLPPATPSLPPVAASPKAEAIASAPSLPDELVDSSVSPRTRSTGEAISEAPSPVVVDLATPQAPAALPPATPSLPPVAASTKAEAIASAPSLPDELVDSSVSPRTRSTGEAISEAPSPVVADLATPQAPAALPPATPSLPPVAASTKAEAIASAPSLPDELVDSSVSPRTRSTGEAISEAPSPVVADLATPQAPASLPPVTPSPPQTFGQATPGTPIERAKAPAAQLIVGQASSRGAGEAFPLNISLSNAPAGAMIGINGLAAGSTLTVGRASGAGGWRLMATELREALVRPPQGFVGAMELGLELRLANDSVADLKTLHLEWVAPAVAQTTRPVFVVRHLDSDEVAALVKRGEGFIASGDLASARLMLQRAAEAGEAQAALLLAGTYDPIVLEKLGLQGPTADIEKARTWYKRARELGSAAAPGRLQLLAGRDR